MSSSSVLQMDRTRREEKQVCIIIIRQEDFLWSLILTLQPFCLYKRVLACLYLYFREKSKLLEEEVAVTNEDKSQTPLSCNPSPWRRRKKNLAYCECCYQTFNNQEEVSAFSQNSFILLYICFMSVIFRPVF